MHLTRDQIERRRSPGALRRFVLKTKESVILNGQERHLGILKKGIYKEFLDEIVPLSCFAALAYEEDVQVLPVLGNQGYDARVFDAHGREFDRIEITAPCDGAREAADARQVVSSGLGPVRIGEPGDDFDKLMDHVLSTCRDKSMKDYRDCTLVISIEPQPSFTGFESRFEETLARLSEELCCIDFMARRVFLMLLPDRLVPIRGTLTSPPVMFTGA